MNDFLDQKLAEFIENIEDRDNNKKSYFHYNSVINLTKAMKFHSNEKAQYLKKLLLEYYFKVEKMEYLPLEKIESALMYRKYLSPVGSYLIHRNDFITKANLKFFILFGIIIDSILAYLIKGYYYPIFIFIFFASGYYK